MNTFIEAASTRSVTLVTLTACLVGTKITLPKNYRKTKKKKAEVLPSDNVLKYLVDCIFLRISKR